MDSPGRADSLAAMRTVESPRSGELFARAERVLVEGVSSPSRGPAHFTPYPLYMERGEGAEIIDVDGNRFVDMMMAFGALVHGHAHPRLVQVLQDAATRGALFATGSEVEVELAERLHAAIPSAGRVRFANTGTEAAMGALRIARGFTGRDKLLKFEGHYHGWADAYSVSSNVLPGGVAGHRNAPVPVADSSGIPAGALGDTVLAPWNDADAVEAALRRHPGQIAAIVTEPVMANMGVIPPADGFLTDLRRLADEHDTLLYIDETVTGFRLGPGGAQQRFGVTPDISTFGKGLGAGLPVAAIVGREDIMDSLRAGRVLHYGTHNANQILLAVALASVDMLLADDAAAFAVLEARAEQLVRGLREALAAAGLPALVQGVGPMLQVLFLRDGSEHVAAITDARDFAAHVDPVRFNSFVHRMFAHGVYLSPLPALHSVLSTAHTEAHVRRIVEGAQGALDDLAETTR
jgi:glutamate-1-semialdehyde 2,1-aminomutase